MGRGSRGLSTVIHREVHRRSVRGRAGRGVPPGHGRAAASRSRAQGPTEATRVHPLAIRVMDEVGIDLGGHTSKRSGSRADGTGRPPRRSGHVLDSRRPRLRGVRQSCAGMNRWTRRGPHRTSRSSCIVAGARSRTAPRRLQQNLLDRHRRVIPRATLHGVMRATGEVSAMTEGRRAGAERAARRAPVACWWSRTSRTLRSSSATTSPRKATPSSSRRTAPTPSPAQFVTDP